MLNITAVEPADSGYLKAYPGQDTSTGTSILNFPASQRTAGLGLIYTASNNSFVISNSAASPVDIVLDINGYFQ